MAKVLQTRVIGHVYAVIQPFDASMGNAVELFHVKADAAEFVKTVQSGYIKELDVKVIEP